MKMGPTAAHRQCTNNISALGNCTLEPFAASEHGNETNNAHTSKLTCVQLVCFSVIVTMGLIGNLLISVAILKRRKLRIIDYFVLNLAVTDLATCIVSIPFDFVVILTRNWPFGSVLCKIVFPLQTTFMAVSVYTLLLMSWERHRAVMPPFKPKFKTKRTVLVIFLVWVLCIAVVGPYFAIHDVKVTADNRIQCDEGGWPSDDYSKAFTLLVFIILYLLPLLAITANYIRISQKLWRDIQRLRRAIGERHGNRIPLIKARAHRNLRLVKVFVVAVSVFAVCMAPNHVLWLWHDYGSGGSFKYFKSVLVFCHLLVYANSAINPFIFVFLHSRYCKHFLMKCFHSTCCTGHTQPADNNSHRYRRRRARKKPGVEEFVRLYPINNAYGPRRNYILRDKADQEPPRPHESEKQFHCDLPQEPTAEDVIALQGEKDAEVYHLREI